MSSAQITVLTRHDEIACTITIVQDHAELADMERVITAAPYYSYDTESSGLKPQLGARIIGHCFATIESSQWHAWYVPVRHVGEHNADAVQLPIADVNAVVQRLFLQKKPCVMHHGKFDIAQARADGLLVSCPVVDTAILAVIANENETSFGLKQLATLYCCADAKIDDTKLDNWMKIDARGLKLCFKKRSKKTPGQPTYLQTYGYARTPIELCGKYGAMDAFYTLWLWLNTYRDTWARYPEVAAREHAMLWRLHAMEWRGLLLDVEQVHIARDRIAADLAHWLTRCRELAGDDFELSPAYLKVLLYERLALPAPKQTKSGVDSTDRESRSILRFAHPEHADLLYAIDKASVLEKLRSTYAESFLLFYSPETQHLYPSYNQIERRDEGGVPVTGRLSCVASWTEITTQDGVKPIAAVVPGDYVWTHRARWRKVLRSFTKGPGHMYSVRFSNGEVLTCTTDHKLLTASGRWLRTGVLICEHFKSLGFAACESQAGAQAVQIKRGTDGRADRKAARHDLPERLARFANVDARGRTQGAREGTLFGFQVWHQESDARQEGEGAPALEGNLRRRLRLPDVLAQREASVCAPRGDGQGVGTQELACPARSASHRHRSDEQQSRQLGADNEEGAQGHSLFAGEGLPTVEIAEVHYLGSFEVYDLTVDEDASYAACGVFSHNSSDPNIQNIASRPLHLLACKCEACVAESLHKKVKELDELERALVGEEVSISIRRYFTVRPGYIRVYLDFSQIELRVLAWFSRDPKLLYCYANDMDVHAMTSVSVTGGDRHVAKCFHPDTEVLTRSGWKQITALRAGEEIVQATPTRAGVELSWVVPMEVFTKQNDRPTLVHLQNEGIDIRVTHDHRMLVVGGTGLSKVVAPKDMKKQRSWLNAGLLSDDSSAVVCDELLLRLAVAVQADGSYVAKRIRLRFTKQRKIDRLRALLERAAAPECWQVSAANNFVIKGELAARIRGLLDEDKSLPWWWLSLSEHARNAVLDEAAHWDSCGPSQARWRMYRYASCVRKNVDVLQALASITSRKTRVVVEPRDAANWQDCWYLSVKGKAHSRGENLSVVEVPYSGEVACLSVPSSFLLVRDKGVPLICGNSVNFGNSYGMSKMGLARRMLGYFEDPEGTRDRAEVVLTNYFKEYAGILLFRGDFARKMRTNGGMFVNPFGRPRRIPDISARERWKRERAERQMMSSIISGTAADIMKESLLRCAAILEDRSPESEVVQTIHDELVLDLKHEPGWADVLVQCKRAMEDWPLFEDAGVPIRTNTAITTTTWEAKREITITPDSTFVWAT